MKKFTKAGLILTLLGGALSGVLPGASAGGAARAQGIVFHDEFAGTSLNGSNWGTATSYWNLHRTRFGLPALLKTEVEPGATAGSPSKVINFARLRLNTFSPDDVRDDPNKTDEHSRYMQAAQIYTHRQFKMGSGLEISARIRGTQLSPGLVMAFFTFSEQGSFPTTLRRDEIDFEMIGNRPSNELWSHLWNDWNPAYGYDRGVHDFTTLPVVPGYDRHQWSVYKVRWLNDRVECYINDRLVRVDRAILPDHPMGLYLNLWAPDRAWTLAYNAALHPATNWTDNKSFFMDVDYVSVRTIAPPVGAVVGGGDGLSATYFPTENFGGEPVSRVEPRLNFNWTGYFPDAKIGKAPARPYSVRWAGYLQAQFTQPYVLTAQTADGVRVWLDNKLIIDRWGLGYAERSSAPIALVAGRRYLLRVEYFSRIGVAFAKLLWSSPSTPRQLVPQSQLYSLAGDRVAPTVSLQSPAAGAVYASLAQATGTSSDVGFGVQQVRVSLYRESDYTYWNGTAWTPALAFLPVTGTSTWAWPMPPLAAGAYKFQASAVDWTGATTFTPWTPFTIDPAANSSRVTQLFEKKEMNQRG